jgi:uncharacterized membrane protein YphA (DoxX/SURF4 family)
LPGLALLLLRLALAAALAASGATAIAGAPDRSVASGVLGVLAVACSGALVLGAFTPAAGILAALVTLTLAASTGAVDATAGWRGARGDGLAFVVSVALVLLGPGAFSVDARLFGWREIVVPRAGRPAPGSGSSRPR